MEFLQTALGDSFEDFKTKIEAYNNENPTERIELCNSYGGAYIPKAVFDETVSSLKKEHAVNTAILSSGAKNLTAVRALIDENAVTLENGELCGMDEQIELLKKSSSFLFEESKKHGVLHGSGEDVPRSDSFIHDIWDNQVKR